MSEILDLRGTLCPFNWVKTKLKLDEMNAGDTLEVILDDGEPILNVPRSARDEGHKIVNVSKHINGSYKLVLQKGSD